MKNKFWRLWLGSTCEEKAKQYLKNSGYQIIKKNHRTNLGEIDLIAKKNEELVFVEVKALVHSDSFLPEDHFDFKKRKKLTLLGMQYLETLKVDVDARFDLITVIKKDEDYFIEHYENVIDDYV